MSDLHDDQLWAGAVALNLFILAIGITFEIIGFLLWHRRIPPNRFVGIRLKAMGDNTGIFLYQKQAICSQ